MRGIRPALALGLAVVALAAAGCREAKDELPTLIGTVGSTDDPDADEIGLRTEDGAKVTTILPPGEYRLELHDRSTVHNFHLRGRYGGADVATGVAGTGTTTAVVLLNEPESYEYFCDAHPAAIRETFSIHERIHTQN
jgi:hypothetical protein